MTHSRPHYPHEGVQFNDLRFGTHQAKIEGARITPAAP